MKISPRTLILMLWWKKKISVESWGDSKMTRYVCIDSWILKFAGNCKEIKMAGNGREGTGRTLWRVTLTCRNMLVLASYRVGLFLMDTQKQNQPARQNHVYFQSTCLSKWWTFSMPPIVFWNNFASILWPVLGFAKLVVFGSMTGKCI